MADELRLSASLGVVNGTLQASQTNQVQSDQTTPGVVQRRQSIATAGATITLTGVTAPRAIIIRNTDATNYVDIGPDSAGSMVGTIRLMPGEFCLLPLKPGIVLKAQANTAAVIIEFLIAET